MSSSSITIGQLATVFHGQHIAASTTGNAHLIGVTQLESQDLSTAQQVNVKNDSDKLLQDHDILIQARGFKFAAYLYRAEQYANQPTVASSALMVIRVYNQAIVPSYLAAWLNSNEAQKQIASLAKGSNILQLKKEDINRLQLNLPGIETQQRWAQAIACSQQLIQQAQQLLVAYQAQHQHLINTLAFTQ